MVNESLTRDAVIDRAVAIADAEGLDAVSIRRVAQELGVTPMALYWHVRNKDELLAAMGDRLFAGIELPAADAPWDDRIHGLMTVLVAALRRHPALLSLAFPRIVQSPGGLTLAEGALRIFRDGGFSRRQGAYLAAHTLRTAIGLVGDQPGTTNGLPDPEHDEHLRIKRAAILSLPPELYSSIIDAVDDLLTCPDQAEYDQLGIDLFIAGLQRLAQRSHGRV